MRYNKDENLLIIKQFGQNTIFCVLFIEGRRFIMKKILMALLMAVSLFVVSSCTSGESKDKTIKKDNFSLFISVNETEFKIGDKIKITVTFTNESDKDIPIQHTDAQTYYGGKLENIFNFDIRDRKEKHIFAEIDIGAEKLATNTIKANAVINRTFEYILEKSGNYKVAVSVFFHTGDDYSSTFNLVSESININVK